MSDLTLFGDSSWQSPWVFHVMVALEEMKLPYKVEAMTLPIPPERKAVMQEHAVFGKVPLLAHGDVWLTESMAITEYLSEQFPAPLHPRILPEDIVERARARQIMSFLRTSLFALREDRPTSSVFSRPVTKPMSDKGKADAAELLRVADHLIEPGRTTLFKTWCVADADFALALMRIMASGDSLEQLDQKIVKYAVAQWGRLSVRKYLGYIPTSA